MKFYDELKWRGLIQDVSSPEVEKIINEGNATFYDLSEEAIRVFKEK